ncbi:MAG TPA: PIN domain-containing protein [Candidatus Nanoarchaeia archaeon]|nr:PIN domain-containing protein [Candidatus Nanoarchaeia archaeon]
MSRYFFDSYALFEIIYGNEKFKTYAESGGVTTIFNIAELNYGLKKIKTKDDSDSNTEKFKSAIVRVEWEDIINAMDLKSKMRFLSIPDAIGYTVAKRMNIQFLTGDDDFKDLPNVELVKK